eukprot:TRINITY_DN9059_c0_g1_i1.p1 TRINITY_DN9059_c0_g1~~TRINITY_DN9059_c0_g1_i1.p1  ORF type:complete len:319 (+),score=61.19 TRINITY_DN9059_c0_g1_i1:57-959(+)
MDGQQILDKVQEKCPAFKDGKCPYKDSSESFKEALKKCPKFKDGCPFQGDSIWQVLIHFQKESGEIDWSTIGDKCPAFTEGKCPFASEASSLAAKLKGCPSFKSGCPFKSSSVFTSSIKDACPAFKDGCPYAKNLDEYKAALKDCPAFKDNKCPFSKDDSVAAVFAHMHSKEFMSELEGFKEKCPAFSKGEGSAACPFKNLLPKLAEDAKKCPLFQNGCPFHPSHSTSDSSSPFSSSSAGGCPFLHGKRSHVESADTDSAAKTEEGAAEEPPVKSPRKEEAPAAAAAVNPPKGCPFHRPE